VFGAVRGRQAVEARRKIEKAEPGEPDRTAVIERGRQIVEARRKALVVTEIATSLAKSPSPGSIWDWTRLHRIDFTIERASTREIIGECLPRRISTRIITLPEHALINGRPIGCYGIRSLEESSEEEARIPSGSLDSLICTP
jgi:hypothetical protein